MGILSVAIATGVLFAHSYCILYGYRVYLVCTLTEAFAKRFMIGITAR